MPRIQHALALPLLAGLVGCSLPLGWGGAPDLVGTQWRLERLGGIELVDPPQSPPTLAFPEPGRVSGFGSCNRFFGTYTLVKSRIAFGQMGMTRMACPGPVGEQEARFMAALQKVQTVRVEGNRLLLSEEGQPDSMRFVRIGP